MFKRFLETVIEPLVMLGIKIWPYKYIAKNDLTGIWIKGFRTEWGAKRWYNRPVKLMGMRMTRPALFITIYEVEYEKNPKPELERFEGITFDYVSEAQDVLNQLQDLIANYDQVTKAELYDLLDITSHYSDTTIGWTDLSAADLDLADNKWYLMLPAPKPLD